MPGCNHAVFAVLVVLATFAGKQTLDHHFELVGLEMVERGIARHGYPVLLDRDAGESAGVVTSGTQAPTLGKALAMAYLPIEAADTGREVFVSIRNRAARARVVELPFYSRKKK